MAHVTSRHIEVDGKFYLIGGPNDEIIGGPYASAAEADHQSRLVSQMVGEAPIEDYRAFLSSPRTSTKFEGREVREPSERRNIGDRLSGLLEGPVGDEAYRQPPELDWKQTAWPVLDWPWINTSRFKKRPNLPDVEEWNPSNDYKIRVLR